MKISIIIPALNEEKYISKLLTDIKSQTFKDFEVIVADAGSKDKTIELAKKYNAKVVKGGLPGVGRNAGAKVAFGEFLFFIDADIRLPKSFLKKAYSEIKKRNLHLATCEFKPISNFLVDKVIFDTTNVLMKLVQYSRPLAPGACILVSHWLFDKVGGFDEKVKLAEDHDLIRRANKIKRLRVLNNTYIRMSVRRLDNEGRIRLGKKYMRVFFYRLFKGEIRKDIINYKFNYSNKKERQKLEKSLQRLENQLIRINESYKKISKSLKKEELNESYNKNLSRLKKQFNRAKETFKKSINKNKK